MNASQILGSLRGTGRAIGRAATSGGARSAMFNRFVGGMGQDIGRIGSMLGKTGVSGAGDAFGLLRGAGSYWWGGGLGSGLGASRSYSAGARIMRQRVVYGAAAATGGAMGARMLMGSRRRRY